MVVKQLQQERQVRSEELANLMKQLSAEREKNERLEKMLSSVSENLPPRGTGGSTTLTQSKSKASPVPQTVDHVGSVEGKRNKEDQEAESSKKRFSSPQVSAVKKTRIFSPKFAPLGIFNRQRPAPRPLAKAAPPNPFTNNHGGV